MTNIRRWVAFSGIAFGGLSACTTLEESYKTNLGIARGPITLNCAASLERVYAPAPVPSEIVFGVVEDGRERPVVVERDGKHCRRDLGFSCTSLNYQFDPRTRTIDIFAEDARRVLSATGFTLLTDTESLSTHRRLDFRLTTVYVDHSYSFTSRIEAIARFGFMLRITRIADDRTLWSTEVKGEDRSVTQGILSDATVEEVLNGAYCDALVEFRNLASTDSFRGYLQQVVAAPIRQ